MKLDVLNRELSKKDIKGEWPIFFFSEAKVAGIFYTTSIKIKRFNKKRISFICNNLWFYSKGEEIEVWNNNTKKNERAERIYDLLNDIEANQLMSIESDKLFSTLVYSKMLYIDYHNFMQGLLKNNEGIILLNKYFSHSSNDIKKFINQYNPRQQKRIPSNIKPLVLKLPGNTDLF